MTKHQDISSQVCGKNEEIVVALNTDVKVQTVSTGLLTRC